MTRLVDACKRPCIYKSIRNALILNGLQLVDTFRSSNLLKLGLRTKASEKFPDPCASNDLHLT
jgi:hypothetical protein